VSRGAEVAGRIESEPDAAHRIPPFRYSIVWHPRIENDELDVWLGVCLANVPGALWELSGDLHGGDCSIRRQLRRLQGAFRPQLTVRRKETGSVAAAGLWAAPQRKTDQLGSIENVQGVHRQA
jgi:hypothetical protein